MPLEAQQGVHSSVFAVHVAEALTELCKEIERDVGLGLLDTFVRPSVEEMLQWPENRVLALMDAIQYTRGILDATHQNMEIKSRAHMHYRSIPGIQKNCFF